MNNFIGNPDRRSVRKNTVRSLNCSLLPGTEHDSERDSEILYPRNRFYVSHLTFDNLINEKYDLDGRNQYEHTVKQYYLDTFF